MTLYGIDISNFQAGIDLARVAEEGFSWVEAKVSEGNYYRDPTWASNRAAAERAGLPIIGYHYAISSSSPASQVQTWQANGGPNVCMIDFENNSGNINDFWTLVHAFNSAGITVALSYIPQWYWRNIGSPDLSQVPGLISSAYPGGTGYASAIYSATGGDSGSGWAAYGNANPVIWQFTDKATVAGRPVDANAFRGTITQLTTLLTGRTTPGGSEMQLTDTWKDAYGNDIAVGDLLKWICLHGDIIVNLLGGPGAQALLPPNLKMPGHACLGGDDILTAFARIGQALNLSGYDPALADQTKESN